MIQVEQYEVGLIQTRLGILSVALEKGARVQWFPVRHVVRALEIAGEDRQVEVVKEHYSDALRTIPIKMAVGWRDVLCIRRKEMALWIAGINPKKCKLAAREPLEAYRDELLAAADQLFWKHISLGSSQAIQVERRETSAHTHAESEGACPACGVAIKVVIIGDSATWELVGEEE